ncbi:MAG: hypothetical protein ACYC4U_26640 [Pirellulaceae bacterium]
MDDMDTAAQLIIEMRRDERGEEYNRLNPHIRIQAEDVEGNLKTLDVWWNLMENRFNLTLGDFQGNPTVKRVYLEPDGDADWYVSHKYMSRPDTRPVARTRDDFKLFPTEREVQAVRTRLENMGCTVDDNGFHWTVTPEDTEAEGRLVDALEIDPCKLKKWGFYNVAYHEIHWLLKPEH